MQTHEQLTVPHGKGGTERGSVLAEPGIGGEWGHRAFRVETVRESTGRSAGPRGFHGSGASACSGEAGRGQVTKGLISKVSRHLTCSAVYTFCSCANINSAPFILKAVPVRIAGLYGQPN